MTAPLHSGAAGFLARFAGLGPRLPGAHLPFVVALRAAAAEAFGSAGFPSRRSEAWRYTDLRPVSEAGFAEALGAVDSAPKLPAALGARRAVFVDGRFRPDLSTGELRSLARSLPAQQGRLGALARPLEQPMAALNTMLFEDGLVLTVPAGTDVGLLEILSLASGGERPTACHPRHLIRLEAGARLVLIEQSRGPDGATYLHNPVHEIALAAGARLHHTRILREGDAGHHLGTVYAALESGAVYDGFALLAGGRLLRNEVHLALLGPQANARLDGVQLVADGQHADTTTALDHAAPDCASRQTCKTVLTGRSRGVFQGRILVRRPAQRTDGYQMNQALLLSDTAEMDSKPQLEIYADDVKCSHGATVGALDPDQLFYLRARGIAEPVARAMLVRGFLQQLVDDITEPVARDAVEAAVTGWWEGQA